MSADQYEAITHRQTDQLSLRISADSLNDLDGTGGRLDTLDADSEVG